MVSSPVHHTSSLLERLVKVKTPHFALHTKRGHGDNLFDIPMADDSNGGNSTSELHVDARECQCPATKQKHVAFGAVSSRSYGMVIGDHPCCNLGCPLSLGWEYDENPRVSVDEYEASRSPRRCLKDLKTTWDQRRTMLSDVPEAEVKRAERKLHRERSCLRKVCARTSAAFFSMETIPMETIPEGSNAAACSTSEPSTTSAAPHTQCT
jgi:hypothetical protein